MRTYWGIWLTIWASVLLVLSLVAGCSCPGCRSDAPQPETQGPADPYEITGASGYLRAWRDPVSGCQYLKMSVNGGYLYAPRLNARGLPDCPGTRTGGEVVR